jgi:hypothetical protein
MRPDTCECEGKGVNVSVNVSVEGLLDALLKQSLATFTGGQKLAKFLHTNQAFLRPLDPVPSDIPPEPDL